MKLVAIATAAALTLSACGNPNTVARVGPGDIADAATTAVGLSRGFAEANPMIAACGNAAPLCAIGIKYAMKEVFIVAGVPPLKANMYVESGGWGAACFNVATMASAVPAVAAVIGVTCGIASFRIAKNQHAKG